MGIIRDFKFEVHPEQLKNVREILGLTADQVGYLCKLSKPAILNIENGYCAKDSTLLLINYALNDYCNAKGIDLTNDKINHIIELQQEINGSLYFDCNIQDVGTTLKIFKK